MLAIIGGSGLSKLDILERVEIASYSTPFGKGNVDILHGELNQQQIVFLPRHGSPHTIAPHRINYRANLWALREHGVKDIIAVNAVGGIAPQMAPGRLAIPDQLIDYTYGRAHTIHDQDLDEVVHIDFTHPYSKRLRHMLILAVEQEQLEGDESEDSMPMTEGVYGCTQGPRLETAAEILRMRRDGCDMVGMTGMPEASLAREFGINYACLALSVNRAAGLEEAPITMEAISNTLATGMLEVKRVLQVFVELYKNRVAARSD